MKKRLAVLLAALLALSALPALAEPVSLTFFGDILEEKGHVYISELVGGGQDLYALVNTDDGFDLYHWQIGMASPELWVSGIVTGGTYQRLEDAKKYGGERDYAHTMDKLFIYEGRLAALNAFDGTVFTVEKKDGQIVYTPLAALEWDSYLKMTESGYNITALEAVDGKLYLSTQFWGDEGVTLRLDAFDVNTGKARQVEAKFVTGMTPYKDGQLIVSIYNQDNAYDHEKGQMTYPTLQILNPADGKLQKFYDCDEGYGGGLRYDAATDSLYFLHTSGIQVMKALGAPQVCALTAVDGWGEADSALLDGGLYALVSQSLLTVKSTNSDELSDVVLNVSDVRPNVSYAFSKDHPNVPILNAGWQDIEELIAAGIGKSAGTDIFQVSSDMLDRAISKGFALDLSGNAKLMAEIGKMHPAVQKACMRDGKLYAFPAHAYSPAVCIENSALKDLPIKPEDIPTNWLDLCAFINEHGEVLEEEHGIRILGGGKSNVFYQMFGAYQDYYTYTGEPLTFDTPLFRQLMTAFESLKMPSDDEMIEALWEMPSLLGDYGNPLSGGSLRLPLTLSADTPYVATTDSMFYFVNPNTKNPELAAELLTYVPIGYEEETRVILYPGITEPAKSPYFERQMADMQKALEDAKKQIETAEPADKAMYEDSIKWYEDALQHPERFEYAISLDAFNQYRELVKDNLIISARSILNATGKSSEELYPLNERYFKGQIKLEEYIQKLEKITQMILKEQQ